MAPIQLSFCPTRKGSAKPEEFLSASVAIAVTYSPLIKFKLLSLQLPLASATKVVI